MSRYLILVILNTPFIVAGLLNNLVGYKMGKVSKARFVVRTGFWVAILLGLIIAQPLYDYLFSANLTTSTSLSDFDVLEVTGIVFVFLVANRARTRLDLLERRVQDLHQELSIRLSEDESGTLEK